MTPFNITFLGCGSATPTLRHMPTSQVVNLRDKLYLIDCGEATQLQMRKMHVRFNRLNHVFVSHLHGDHCFGLPGLISTLGMLGRQGELVIHGPKALNDFLQPVLALFCKELPYQVRIHTIDPTQHVLVMEDRSLSVFSLPLRHRIPTCGYVFVEKQQEARLLRDAVDFYEIPLKIQPSIKQGADYLTPQGVLVPNARLTQPSSPSRRYAFCSDTAFAPEIVPWIEGVDCLYHESTFRDEDRFRAKQTFHSTAAQAAEIARLAGVKKLLIGHYSARYDNLSPLLAEARAVFPETYLSQEEMVVELH